MRHKLFDGVLFLAAGLWIAMGGYLFGDSQPSASAAKLRCAYCPSPTHTCPSSVGTCASCWGAQFGICDGVINPFSTCTEIKWCPGVDPLGFTCFCVQHACFV
jgi:hypothetical protein